MHGRKSQVVPRNFIGSEELHFKAFSAGMKIRIKKAGPQEEIHLIDKGQVGKDVGLQIINFCPRLLLCFTQGAGCDRFPVFQPSGRKRPFISTWFNGTFAHQDRIAHHWYGADNHFGIFVMDGMATITNKSQTVISFGHLQRHFGTALRAEIHNLVLSKKKSVVYSASLSWPVLASGPTS